MTLTINKKTYEAGELVAYVEKLENENAELKKRIEWLDMAIDCDIPVADKIAELEKKIENIRNYLAYNIPHELINEATNKIWHMI